MARPAATEGPAKWRPRRELQSELPPSNGEAAPASDGKYKPPIRERPSADSTPPAEDKPAGGRYVPGAFRRTKLGTDTETPPAPEKREIRRDFSRTTDAPERPRERVPERTLERRDSPRADAPAEGDAPSPAAGGKYRPPAARTGGWGRK